MYRKIVIVNLTLFIVIMLSGCEFKLLEIASTEDETTIENGTVDPKLQATVDKFLDLNDKERLNSPEGKNLFTGELQEFDAPAFGPIPPESLEIFPQDEENALGRFQFTDGYTFDIYMYWTLGDSWQLEAIRAMSLPGFIRMQYAALVDVEKRTDEEQRLFAEVERFFYTDAEWIDWFDENQSSLVQICDELKMAGGSAITTENVVTFSAIEIAFKELEITSIDRSSSDYLKVNMNGILDNSVGFICSPSKMPPDVSPREYIWVEEVSDGWYLFRTT